MTLPKIKGVRYYIAGLLMLVTLVNYLDRTCLGVVGPTLKEKLSIDEKHFSYIIMCFQISYMIMQPLFGRIMDWLNIKRGFSLAILWWSIANMLHAFARTPLTFGIFRGLLGIGEAGNFPGIAKTASEWFPPKERTMATGIANIGAGTGALIAGPLCAWLIIKFGWQSSFVVTGALGIVLLVIWQLLYHNPEKHPLITEKELKYIRQSQQEIDVEHTTKEKGVWRLVLKQRNFWGIGLARFLSEPAWQFFTYWIPLYLVTKRGMNLKDIGYFLWIPFLAADFGSLVGGMLSPMYQKLGLSVLTARKASMTTAACMMPFSLLIATAPSGGWAIFWFCVGEFGHQCISATLLTLPADLFPKRAVATANGLTGFLSFAGGFIFTWIIGAVVPHLGYTPVFSTIAVLDLLGAVLIWSMLRIPKIESQPVNIEAR